MGLTNMRQNRDIRADGLVPIKLCVCGGMVDTPGLEPGAERRGVRILSDVLPGKGSHGLWRPAHPAPGKAGNGCRALC